MDHDELELRFTHHAPKGGQAFMYEQIRAEAKAFAKLVNDLVPESREKSLAMTKIEEAVMHANSGIARRI